MGTYPFMLVKIVKVRFGFDALASIHASISRNLYQHVFLELDFSQVTRDVFINIQSLCNQWNQETPKLWTFKQSYPSSVHAIKNTRRKMEDKHVILPYFNNLFNLSKVCL